MATFFRLFGKKWIQHTLLTRNRLLPAAVMMAVALVPCAFAVITAIMVMFVIMVPMVLAIATAVGIVCAM